jgi:hypothetical protein
MLLVGISQFDYARVPFPPADSFRTVLAVKGPLRRAEKRVAMPLAHALDDSGAVLNKDSS